MSNQITTEFVDEFKSGIDLLLQARGSMIRPHIRVETQNAEEAFYDRIGQTAAVLRTTRHGDTPLIETPHDRRSVRMDDYEWADLIDDQDKIRLLNDPTNAYSRNAAFAMGRSMDDVIVAAAFGTARTGRNGSGTATFASESSEIASGGTGLTLDKLRETKALMDEAENAEDDPRFIVHTATQMTDLLEIDQVISSDYAAVKALVRGDVDTYMGFTFVRVNNDRLPISGNDRDCIAFTRSGLLLALGQDSTGRISERDDKSYSTQVYYSMTIGAVRMEGGKVVKIICDEVT